MTDRAGAYQKYCRRPTFSLEQMAGCRRYVDICFEQSATRSEKDKYLLQGEKGKTEPPSFKYCLLFSAQVVNFGMPKGFVPTAQDLEAVKGDFREVQQEEIERLITGGDKRWQMGAKLLELAYEQDSGPFGIDAAELQVIYDRYSSRKPSWRPATVKEAEAYLQLAKDMLRSLVEIKSGYQTIEERGSDLGCRYRESKSTWEGKSGESAGYREYVEIECESIEFNISILVNSKEPSTPYEPSKERIGGPFYERDDGNVKPDTPSVPQERHGKYW